MSAELADVTKVPALAGLGALYGLATLLSGIAVGIRRLHDTGRSGWFQLLALIPCGGLVVIYFMILPSSPGDNEYGAEPGDEPAV